MEKLTFDLSQKLGPFKLLNATNGGPIHKRKAVNPRRTNFPDYKAARIPYARNHDCGVQGTYGGPHSHDITNIFPNFDADPYAPESYDFICTDESILAWLEAGTKTYFRLGQTIEHQVKKYGTLPPKDFHKWAVICEHIIRHYTEGWADGYELDMPYWEIWNEPDLTLDDAANKPTWGGTRAQFFDLYEIAAKHLKTCFPHLKIGGPALAFNLEWAEDFLQQMQKRNVPIDFFSWHIYRWEPKMFTERACQIKELLAKYGYGNAESHLNEWNYIKNWSDMYQYSFSVIHGMKGAAFTMSCICEAQKGPIDMLMYYDTRPSTFNGAFDYYTLKPLKGYYPLYWYGSFYDLTAEVRSVNEIENIYSLCGVDEQGKAIAIVTYYTDEEGMEDKQLAVDFGKEGKYKVYLLDEEHTNELVGEMTDLTFTMKPCTCILIKEV